MRWSLLGPPGTVVSNRSFTGSDSNDLGGSPALNLPAGVYQLNVSATAANTGAYSFKLSDLATATSYTPGSALSGTLNPAIQSQLFKFTANAGDKVFFDVQTALNAGGVFRLLDPFGQQVFFTGSDVDTFTATATGTYTLLVEGRIFAAGNQAFTADVQPVVNGGNAITIGSVVSGAIDEQGEQDIYTFTLAGTTNIVFDTLTNANSVNWTLVGPA